MSKLADSIQCCDKCKHINYITFFWITCSKKHCGYNITKENDCKDFECGVNPDVNVWFKTEDNRNVTVK
jgi:hypothetical protein